MAKKESFVLSCNNPNSRHVLTIWRFGQADARPKAYVQAALHADEIPALLVLNHLQRLLSQAEATKRIEGEIIVVPVANPLGLNQFFLNYHIGRYELNTGQNFNRGFPDISEAVKRRVGGQLTDDAQQNIATIREAMRQESRALQAQTPIDSLRLKLFRSSVDADIILDLHCDNDALMHLYTGTPNWPDAEDLAAELNSQTILLADDSGGNPFDEAAASVWWRLATAFPDKNIPPACLAATVELRGESDVDENLAAEDANALFRFLQRRAVISGNVPTLTRLRFPATPLTAVEMIRNPHAGVICFNKKPGDVIKQGEQIGIVINPLEPDFDKARTPIHAGTSGLFFARVAKRFMPANQVIAKIAGVDDLPDRLPGQLMHD